MPTPLLLALALIQAPNTVPVEEQVVLPDAEPALATGIAVQLVWDAPPPAPPNATAFRLGVVPSMNPCSWSYRCLYRNPDGSLVMGDYAELLVAWSVREAQEKEFLQRNQGYLAGRAMAAEKARLEGSSSGPRPQPPPAATTESGFSGGMYVGKTPTGGGGGPPVQTGKPGGKI